MKKVFLCSVLVVMASLVSAEEKLEMWYRKPAKDWSEALPIGNGRMGAMIFGCTDVERIQLNEDSMWAGPESPKRNSQGTPADLDKIRKMIFANKYSEAYSFMTDAFSRKDVTRSHQTLGDLWIDWKDDAQVSNYRRSLDLNTGVSVTRWEKGDTEFVQKVFCSNPDEVLVVHLKSNKELNFELKLNRPLDKKILTHKTQAEGTSLIMEGTVTQNDGKIDSISQKMSGVDFLTICDVRSSGLVTRKGDILEVSGSKEVTLRITASTSLSQNNAREDLAKIKDAETEGLLARHIDDHQSLMGRCTLEIENSGSLLPSDERLEKIRKGEDDTGLACLLFQYGRYLLIASSRANGYPANLQGLWNDKIKAPWNSDYHLNINLQMNYWHANVTNLEECNEPLFVFLKRLAESGEATAKEQYNMRGWVCHHATDIWGPTWMRTREAQWGGWIHGGGWMSQHLWTHYDYTRDKVFLKKTAWPLLCGKSRFYLDWLVEKDGKLISVPDSSPENNFISPVDGKKSAVCAAASMGQQIINEVFTNTLSAARELGIENELTKEIERALPKLEKGLNVGSDGRLLEWDKEYKEREPGHRHMSHLYAFLPGVSVTDRKAPELMKAVRKSIAVRVEHGSVDVGWSRAWAINIYARLKEPEAAHYQLNEILKRQTMGNYFNNIFGNKRNRKPIFQIEANFGVTAGIAEMLVQSHDELIELLPALPKAWAHGGKITGVKTRGGFEVSFEWKDGKVKNLEIEHATQKEVRILYNGKVQQVRVR